MSNPRDSGTEAHRSWIANSLAVLLLTLITVYAQEQVLGLSYIEGEQMARHNAVMNGTSLNPWSYRILSEYVGEAFIHAACLVTQRRAVVVGLLMFRLLQNAFLFVFALRFYRLVGLTARESFIGIVLLAYSMTHALNNSDLSFNTYSDLCFYLFAGWFVLKYGPSWWLLPISFLAALNRETCLFIPFLPLGALLAAFGRGWRRWMPQLRLASVCLLIQIATLATLRVFIPTTRSIGWREDWGNAQGWETVVMNLSSAHTVSLLILTFSVLPLALAWNFRNLPMWLKGMFWVMVPAWIVVHIAMVYANETRIFLVPIALVIIPAALYARPMGAPTVEIPGDHPMS